MVKKKTEFDGKRCRICYKKYGKKEKGGVNLLNHHILWIPKEITFISCWLCHWTAHGSQKIYRHPFIKITPDMTDKEKNQEKAIGNATFHYRYRIAEEEALKEAGMKREEYEKLLKKQFKKMRGKANK